MEESEIISKALEAKRGGDLYSAISIYGSLLDIDRHHIEAYYGLGKVYYLLGDYDAALRHLLIAQHLRINAFAENPASEVMVKELPEALRKRAMKISDKIVYLLIDVNTPRHIAHALYDYSDLSSERQEHIEEYRNELMGLRMPAEEDSEYRHEEEDFYYTLGIDLALNLIDTDIEDKEIVNYYLSDFADFKGIFRKIFMKEEKPEQ